MGFLLNNNILFIYLADTQSGKWRESKKRRNWWCHYDCTFRRFSNRLFRIHSLLIVILLHHYNFPQDPQKCPPLELYEAIPNAVALRWLRVENHLKIVRRRMKILWPISRRMLDWRIKFQRKMEICKKEVNDIKSLFLKKRVWKFFFNPESFDCFL